MPWNKEWIMGAFNGAAAALAAVVASELVWFLLAGERSPWMMALLPAVLAWSIAHTTIALKWRRQLKEGVVRNRPTLEEP